MPCYLASSTCPTLSCKFYIAAFSFATSLVENITDYQQSYVQFAPLAYISKLYIEIEMANLIFKVVRSSSTGQEHSWVYGSSHNKSQTGNKSVNKGSNNATTTGTKLGGNTMISRADKVEAGRLSSSSELELANYPGPHGITRTIETTVVSEDQEGVSSKSGSSHNPNHDYGWNHK